MYSLFQHLNNVDEQKLTLFKILVSPVEEISFALIFDSGVSRSLVHGSLILYIKGARLIGVLGITGCPNEL